jgi:hypothetical protein
MEDDMATKLLRYRDLEAAGIVGNRMRLKRLVEAEGFPSGFMLSANTRVWQADEVQAWLDAKRTGGLRNG